MATFKVKGLVDKENNRVLFIESNADFVDVLFSFLTMPLGAVIRLTRNLPPPVGIGCLTKLYGCVESLDEKKFRTKICKTMLLQPRNGAEDQFKELKLHIEDVQSDKWYLCEDYHYDNIIISRCPGPSCGCGKPLEISRISASKSEASYAEDRGVYVKEQTRHIITDELEVIPLSTAVSFSLFSKLGLRDESTIEERPFDIGVEEVLNLLKFSLVSTNPLTETFSKHKKEPELKKESCDQGSFIDLLKCSLGSTNPMTETLLNLKPEAEPRLSKECYDQGSCTNHETKLLSAKGNGKICIRLLVSKSKKMVCYADVGEDFVDLLLGFLTIPLGHITKEMDAISSKGRAHSLYKSVYQLDALKYLKSDERKEILLNPKIAPGFGFEKQLLGVEEALKKQYYFGYWHDENIYKDLLTTDKTLFPSKLGLKILNVTAMDPKAPSMKAANGGGFLAGPATFTVSDDLIIRPSSLITGLSILKKLGVPLSDIEEHVVHVGKEEAWRLLVASFASETALTDAFLLGEANKDV